MRAERVAGHVYLTFGLDHGKRMTFVIAPEVAMLDGLVVATMGRDELMEQGKDRRATCRRLIMGGRA